jgi:hypothetical protein
MLSKQSIRKEHTIYLNGKLLEKAEMLELSQEFNEKEEQRLRKMLQQGGKITIKGNLYEIKKSGNKIRNSRGDYELPTKLKKPEDWE